MFEQFIREWGAWSISVLSLGVAALAYVNARRAVRLQEIKHEWEAEDRNKKLAAEQEDAARRAEEAAWLAWCSENSHRLHDSVDSFPIVVPDDKKEWALRGNGKFFDVEREGEILRLHPLGTHVGSVLL